MAKCRADGCGEIVEGAHCEAHRVARNALEESRGTRRTWNDDRCQSCFLHGHEETECEWEPSIYANAETREQAAARIGR